MPEPIGQHIRLVDERNDSSSEPILLGVSIEKVFIPSVANTIGSNMATYKIVRRGQFACSLMQVRRDKKVPVALLRDYEEAIVSPAYPVFEIVDESRLLPEYLMTWMLRPEFDREACFYAVGGVRGSLEWDDFCNMKLPVPAIEKQREIVKEYQTVVNSIQLNRQLNGRLEELAQAVYKKWFVDFDFPTTEGYAQALGKPELEGQFYKSSGGEMQYNEALEMAIPKGWTAQRIEDFCSVTSSRRVFQRDYVDSGVPFYRGKEIIAKKNAKPLGAVLFISRGTFEELTKKNGSPQKGDILLTAVGTLGVSYLVRDEEFYFKDGNVVWLKDFRNQCMSVFLYSFMQSHAFADLIEEITIGSTQSAITIDALGARQLAIPDESTLRLFQRTVTPLVSRSSLCKKASEPLERMRTLVLSRMAMS